MIKEDLIKLGFVEKNNLLLFQTGIVLERSLGILTIIATIKGEEIILSDGEQLLSSYESPLISLDDLFENVINKFVDEKVYIDGMAFCIKTTKYGIYSSLSRLIKYLTILEHNIEKELDIYGV